MCGSAGGWRLAGAGTLDDSTWHGPLWPVVGDRLHDGRAEPGRGPAVRAPGVECSVGRGGAQAAGAAGWFRRGDRGLPAFLGGGAVGGGPSAAGVAASALGGRGWLEEEVLAPLGDVRWPHLASAGEWFG